MSNITKKLWYPSN